MCSAVAATSERIDQAPAEDIGVSTGQLEGKVVVVTGGAGFLCSEISRDLGRRGARVAVLDLHKAAAQAVVDQIAAAGGIAAAFSADVTDVASVTAARDAVAAALGRPSILVNGAGGNQAPAITSTTAFDPREIAPEKPADMVGFFNLDMAAFHRVVQVNIMGTVIPSQVFGPEIVAAGGGSIVNFASMNSYRPLSRVGAYGASKAAIRNFTEWLAAYLAPAGIRVNAIAPGFFVNDRSRKILMTEDGGLSTRGQNVMQHTPMKRFGDANELLGCFNWLIDDEAAGFVTGQTIAVDGGFLACSGL
jgi:NAD(P)-dependent dehydrogenase (short-subunit alcohol dehydrogenase family)